MIHATDSLDFIEELRLRRWARENYCYAAARQDSWHPIIHDEMQQRDLEEMISGERCELSDAGMPLPADFTLLTAGGMPGPTVAAPADLARGRIVPLAPDLHGPHEITPPHMRSESPVEQPEMHYT